MRISWFRGSVLAIAGIVGAVVVASIGSKPAHARDCRATRRDSLAIERAATDTVARLRRRVQRVTEVRPEPGGIGIRTEDTSQAALHDGGLVLFSCHGALRSVWLDGG